MTNMVKNSNNELEQVFPYLPKDILRSILEKVPWRERRRLSLVCKNWIELVNEIQANEFLPWLIHINEWYFDWNKFINGRGGNRSGQAGLFVK